jgi:hypothetical protein
LAGLWSSSFLRSSSLLRNMVPMLARPPSADAPQVLVEVPCSESQMALTSLVRTINGRHRGDLAAGAVCIRFAFICATGTRSQDRGDGSCVGKLGCCRGVTCEELDGRSLLRDQPTSVAQSGPSCRCSIDPTDRDQDRNDRCRWPPAGGIGGVRRGSFPVGFIFFRKFSSTGQPS